MLLLAVLLPQNALALYNNSYLTADTVSIDSIPWNYQWVTRVIGRGIYLDIDFFYDSDSYGIYPSASRDVEDYCGIPQPSEYQYLAYKVLFWNSDSSDFVPEESIFSREYPATYYLGPITNHSYTTLCAYTDTTDTSTTYYEVTHSEGTSESSRRRHYVINRQGNYICRVCYTLLYDGDYVEYYSDETIWNHWSHLNSEIAFTVSDMHYARDIREPQVKLQNVETWKSWLPTAPGFNNVSDNNITLSFQLNVGGVEASSIDYRVKFKVFDITWYPGTRTNSVDLKNWIDNPYYSKYHQFISASSDTILLDQEWNEHKSWRASTDSTVNDFIMDESLNPGYTITWNLGTPDILDTTITEGYYEIEYNQDVPNNSVLDLTYTSRDFGGRCWTTPFIAMKDSSGTLSQWYAVPVYERLFDGEQDYVLPLPRDEESLMYYEKTRLNVGRGDRMADAWEEKFTIKDGINIDTMMAPSLIEEGAIFDNILSLKPYYDNSMFDNSYIDLAYAVEIDTSGLNVTDIGDGLLNFEKYRGFYGILNTSLNRTYGRLNPACRNIFSTSINEITNPTYLSNLERGDSIQYFDSISDSIRFFSEIVSTTINLNTFHFEHIDSLINESLLSDSLCHYYIQDPPLHFNHNSESSENELDKKYVFNLLINNYLRNIPGHQSIASTYNVICEPVPQGYHNFLVGVDPGYYLLPKCGKSVFLDSLNTNRYLESNRLPIEAFTSMTYVGNVLMLEYAREDSGFNYDWIRKQISSVFAHELGHCISLKHPEYHFESIMNSYEQKEPAKYFNHGDLYNLLLTRYIDYNEFNMSNGEQTPR